MLYYNRLLINKCDKITIICQDVPVSCIPFVVPGDASLSGITSGCGQRRFQARFLAHYMDTDLLCP